jgi:hypothetical protein
MVNGSYTEDGVFVGAGIYHGTWLVPGGMWLVLGGLTIVLR